MGVRVGAAVMVFRNGRVLLGKRSSAYAGGTWSFPGGKVEFGETIVNTAKRELFEETGLKAKKLAFAGFTDAPHYGQHWITFFFKCNSFSGKIKVRRNEKMEEFGWFSKTGIPKPLFKPAEDAFKKKFVWKS